MTHETTFMTLQGIMPRERERGGGGREGKRERGRGREGERERWRKGGAQTRQSQRLHIDDPIYITFLKRQKYRGWLVVARG